MCEVQIFTKSLSFCMYNFCVILLFFSFTCIGRPLCPDRNGWFWWRRRRDAYCRCNPPTPSVAFPGCDGDAGRRRSGRRPEQRKRRLKQTGQLKKKKTKLRIK